jgi:ABC-type lipoprotein release transport system permease subunit
MLIRLVAYLRAMSRRRRIEPEINDELQFHIANEIDANIAAGMTPAEARRIALRDFGGLTQTTEAVREVRSVPLELVWQDVRYGARRLRQGRGFVLVAIVSLALAIASAAAVLSIANALFGRDLPVRAPEELVALTTISPDRPDVPNPITLAGFEEIRKRQQDFAALFAWRDALLRNVEVGGERFLGTVNEVSGEYFSTLGVQAFLGRTLNSEDVASIGVGTSARVAVLDYRCWEQRFGGDPDVLGKTLWVDGTPLTVVGVTPKSFAGLNIIVAPDAVVPIGFDTGRIADRATPGVTSLNYYAAARLKPGTTTEQAAAHLKAVWPAILEATVPYGYQGAERTRFLSTRIHMESLRTGTTASTNLRGQLTRPLIQLMALSGLVLVVAYVNLANLVLTRAVARRHELGLRASLGATKAVLIRAMVTEGVLLSLAGAALGLLGAFWVSPLLLRILLAKQPLKPLIFDPLPDVRVVVIGGVFALAVGIVSALAPAWRVIGRDPAAELLPNARVIQGGSAIFQKLLIGSQVSLALVLTAGALLFGQSLYNLHSVNPGFRADGVLQMHLFPQIPGVDSVSYALPEPLVGVETVFPVSAPRLSDTMGAAVSFVGPGFFRAMGMTTLAGRDFEWRDDESAPRVAVISQSLAKRRFPDINPIGQTIDVPNLPYGTNLQIIGVVNSASLWRVQSREPNAVYLALMQGPGLDNPAIELHATTDLSLVAPAADRALESMGYHYSFRTGPLKDQMRYVLRNERAVSIVSAFLAGLTILLSAAGLYGLLSYTVTLRSSEIGIRLAIGAQRRDILLMILREAATLVALGLAVGIPLAVAGLRLAADIVFGLPPHDPMTVGVSVAVLACISFCAAYWPARRACRMDPLTALRVG